SGPRPRERDETREPWPLRPCHRVRPFAMADRDRPQRPCHRVRPSGTARRDGMNRALDVVGAGLGLALASPVLAAAAVAIRLEDGGAVIYRQRRVGHEGRDFDLLKLRTMVVGAETQGAGWAVNRGDPRITKV